jgi:hypothetical protein
VITEGGTSAWAVILKEALVTPYTNEEEEFEEEEVQSSEYVEMNIRKCS